MTEKKTFPILEALEEARVLSVRRTDYLKLNISTEEVFQFYEMADETFYIDFTAQEIRELAAELIAFVEQTNE